MAKIFKLTIIVCLLDPILVTALSPVCPKGPTPTPIFLQLSNCSVPGTSVDSWGLKQSISSPAQFLCLAPSTVVNVTLVIDSGFCQNFPNITEAQCESLCGNTYNPSIAGTSFKSLSPNDILAANLVWTELSTDPLLAGNTSLSLPPSDILSNFSIGIITNGDHQNVGHLGLANSSYFLQDAISNGLIPANGFGLNAGSQSVLAPRDGSLVLGGYDLASVATEFTNYTIGGETANKRDCPFQVTISSLILRFPITGGPPSDVEIISPGEYIPACIEPYDNLFRLPEAALETFQEKTGWNSSTTADPNLLVVEPGLYYPQAIGFNGSLIFMLNNGLVVEVPNKELANPLRGINANGRRVLQPDIIEVNIFNMIAPLNVTTLGKVFLSQVYLAVDYSKNQFQLAPIVPDSASSNVVAFDSASNSCSSSGKSGLTTAEKIAIAICCSLLVAGIIAAWLLSRKIKQKRKDKRSLEQLQVGNTPHGSIYSAPTTNNHPLDSLMRAPEAHSLEGS